MTIKKYLLVVLAMLGIIFSAQASGSAEGEHEEFNLGEMILHHVQDEYKIHFFELGDFHAEVYLPIITYVPGHGFDLFSSSHLFHLEHGEDYNGYTFDHATHKLIKLAEGSKHSTNAHSEESHEDEHVATVDFYDFSITKNVAVMLFSIILMMLMFFSIAKAYKRTVGKAPKGFQSFMEPIIVFVRNDIAEVNLGHKAKRFLPFLLTVFFFIWINNLLGLIPFIGGPNVTGNIAVTLVLASITFLITNLNGNKHYWAHIFAPPGVPIFVLPILWVVEVLGLFTKPFALAVRLFANITAGHMIILALTGIIFTMSEGGTNLGAGFGMSVVSILFSIFMFCLELLVAAIQAFIFTTLSAVFISQAVEDHH